MDNFDPYNVLLSIATNIAVLLMTAFVLQDHIFGKYSWCLLYMCNTGLLIKAQLVISHKSMKTHEADVGHFQDVERL